MRVLLDTNVLSEIGRKDGSEKVRQRILEIPDENIFISVISIGEIAKGISLLDDGNNKRSLRSWLQSLERFYMDRILTIDLEIVQIWGEITASAQKTGITVPAIDGLIAATALRYGLHIMTRNVSDFEHTGAMLINPWKD